MKRAGEPHSIKPSKADSASIKRFPNEAKNPGTAKPDSPIGTAPKLFALLAGIWVAISITKLGNPIIFDQMIETPRNAAEVLLTSWPLSWGYVLVGLVFLAAIPVVSPFWTKECRPIALLGVWLFWQFLSGARSVDARLSNPTLFHFTSCVFAFSVGWWALGRNRRRPLASSGWFWAPVLIGLFYALFTGFEQHNGGLEATRRAFYDQPNWEIYPREYLLKIQSNRIFATLVYPNSLAQLIVFLLPMALWQCWNLTEKWPRVARGVVTGLLGYVGLACLYWSGSKGGWLVALIIAAVIFVHLPCSKKIKTAVITAGLMLGLTVFFLRFSGYFERGATSATARFTYWKAAVQNARANPILGSGPGTFSVPYKRLKAPESEMARLAHNDYLEQATDSGIPGLLTFTAFIWISLLLLYRRSRDHGWLYLLAWAGLLGWALQAFIEFGLYIPAIAWPVFLFFGVLWAMAGAAAEGKTGAIEKNQ